jgi:hypothetical protein
MNDEGLTGDSGNNSRMKWTASDCALNGRLQGQALEYDLRYCIWFGMVNEKRQRRIRLVFGYGP